MCHFFLLIVCDWLGPVCFWVWFYDIKPWLYCKYVHVEFVPLAHRLTFLWPLGCCSGRSVFEVNLFDPTCQRRPISQEALNSAQPGCGLAKPPAVSDPCLVLVPDSCETEQKQNHVGDPAAARAAHPGSGRWRLQWVGSCAVQLMQPVSAAQAL